jgi:hypothetical protein
MPGDSRAIAAAAPWASKTSLLHQLHRWQNGFAEQLIGSIRRECLDHIIGRGASAPDTQILCRLLHRVRTHRSLDKDAPVSRPFYRTGVICSQDILGGLHHQYVRV